MPQFFAARRFNALGFVLCALLITALPTKSAAEAATISDDIVVTATRTPLARLTHVGNITRLTAPSTDGLNLFPADFVNEAAGVQIHRGNGQEHLTAIRSPVLVGSAGAGSFLYLEDGIPMRAAGFANVNALIDAMPALSTSTEIVRGPASALYGSNALHGLINFIGGDIGDTGGMVSASTGSYGRYQLVFQHSLRGQEAARRIGFVVAGESDAFRADSGFEQQKLRVENSWQSGATDYHFSLSGMKLNQETAGYITAHQDLSPRNRLNSARIAALPPACRIAGRAAYAIESCARANANPEAYRDARAARSHLRISHALDNGAQLTLTPYVRNNHMQFLMHFLPTTPTEENSHSSLGLITNYAQSFGQGELILGLDSEYTTGSLSEVQSRPDNFARGNLRYAQGVHYDFDVKALILAPYLHGVWHVADNVDLTTGLRAEYTHYDYTNNTASGLQGLLYRPSSRTNEFSHLAPKLGILLHLTNSERLFVNLARSARTPQVATLYRLRDSSGTGTSPDLDAFRTEILDSVELGYRLATRTIAYEVNFYAMQKRHHHFRDADDLYVTNAKTKHYGVEMDLNWQLNRDWRLAANASYAKHLYAFTRNINNPAQSLESVQNGNAIDSAPRLLAHAALSWNATPRIETALAWDYVGRYYIDAANTTQYGGHQLLNWQATIKAPRNVEVQLKINNLTDKAYATRADKWFGNNRYFPGERRNFAITVSHKF